MQLRRLLFCAIAFICAIAATAGAQGDNALKQAQDSFDQAQIDYLSGKFDEAAEKFKAAHTLRPFPQFLYNVGAAYHMKGKKTSDATAYESAVEYYKKYLVEDPAAADKDKVTRTIGVLEGEIKRLKETTVAPPDPANPTVAPAAPSQEVESLGDVKVRGLVVIESDPTDAYIYLDDRKKGAIAQTPWSGTLEGEHLVIVEKRGYKVAETRIAADPTKLFVLRAVMSEQSNLGWVEITSNVPGAAVFADDKNVGSIGPTPFRGNFPPGKHTFWITAEGYDEVQKDIDVAAGENHDIKVELKGSPVGYLNLRGQGIEDATIYVDGTVLCERGPCRKGVREGSHTVTVRRPGHKAYSRTFTVQPRTETSVKVGFAPKPSRTDAIIAYSLTGIFLGGGIFAGLQSNSIKDSIDKDIKAGNPPVDDDDPRFTRGKIYAIAADSMLALSVITGLTAVYYTFREKGPPSTAIIDVNALSILPQVGPSYAGVGMEVNW
jgi:tetratricopeptide (TPR) repeat protein